MEDIRVAEKILELLGGRKNILVNRVYRRKLCVQVKKMEKVAIDKFMDLEEVLGVTTEEGDIVEIIIDSTRAEAVNHLFISLQEIGEIGNLPAVGKQGEKSGDTGQISVFNENRYISRQEREEVDKYEEVKSISAFSRFLKRIADSFISMLPILVTGGVLGGLVNISDVLYLTESWWFHLLKTLAWVIITYMPVLVCMNVVKEFKGTPFLGGIIGFLFVRNPGMPLLNEIKGLPVILPLSRKVYVPEIGGFLVVIIIGIITAYIERGVRKIFPEILRNFFIPLTILVVSSLAVILLMFPAGEFLVGRVYDSLTLLFDQMEIFGGFVLSSIFLPLSSLGLQRTLVPINMLLSSPEGPTAGMNYILPILMLAGSGQIGAGTALFLKTRNRKLKKIIMAVLPASILGMNDPLVYCVMLPLIKPFIIGCIGSGAGGALAAMFNLSSSSQIMTGFFGFLTVTSGLGGLFIISALTGMAVGFLMTLVLGVNENRIDDIYGR